jgi:hypothetical protein
VSFAGVQVVFGLPAVTFGQSRFACWKQSFSFYGFRSGQIVSVWVDLLSPLFFGLAFIFQVRFPPCLNLYFAFIMAAGVTATNGRVFHYMPNKACIGRIHTPQPVLT